VPPAEVRAMLDTTRATLCRWVREGKFKGIVSRVGNRNKYDPKGLANWLEARKN
jgi:predicted site-specific integrase-resolvase